MDRDIEPPDMQKPLARSRHAVATPPRPEESPAVARTRRASGMRGHVYRISPAERETMHDIGRFRTVAHRDLARHRYPGQDRLDAAGSALACAPRVSSRRRTVWTGPKSEKLDVVVLTKQGKKLLEAHVGSRPSQALYAGFVKPAEVRHDAAIYRMYQAEKQKIEQAGGRIRRVVLDYELKRKVYSPLAKAKACRRWNTPGDRPKSPGKTA